MFGKQWAGAVAVAVALYASFPCLAGNTEVVVRDGDSLVYYWAGPGKEWNRGAAVTTKATGPGAITRHAKTGNLEVVALEAGDLVHYWAAPGRPWNRAGVVTAKATGPGAICPNANGNLEVVAQEGGDLVHYWAAPGRPWNRAGVVTAKATGPGAVTQLAGSGSLQVVVPEAAGLVHYYLAPGKGWVRDRVISDKATGAGAIIQNAANGNREVLVPEGKRLVHYWAPVSKEWNRGGVISENATGPGTLIQDGRKGPLEVVVREGDVLAHYTLDPRSSWARAAFDPKAAGPGAVAAAAGKPGSAVASRHDAQFKEGIKCLEDLEDSLASVVDGDSAKAAVAGINKIWDRVGELRKVTQGLPKLGKEDDAALRMKYEQLVNMQSERLQRVAVAARKASGGEPGFVKAVIRFEEAGLKLLNFGKEPKDIPDPNELYAAARLLSHVRGSPVVSLGLSLDAQAKICDRLLRSASPSIRAAAKDGKEAILANLAIDSLAAQEPLSDAVMKHFQDSLRDTIIRDEDPLDVQKLKRARKKLEKALVESRSLEANIYEHIGNRDDFYRSIFETHLLPPARELAGPRSAAPMVDIRSGSQPIRDAVNPHVVLGSRPCIQVVNVHGKRLQNVVLEVEIEALETFKDRRYFFVPSLKSGESHELVFSVQYHNLSGPPAPSLISYSLWCGDGCEINQVLGGRSRLTRGQLKAATQSKDVLLSAIKSGTTFSGELTNPNGKTAALEFKLERVKKAVPGSADVQATAKTPLGVSTFEGYLQSDNAGGYRLSFLPLPLNPLAATPAHQYHLSARDDVLIFRSPTGSTVELRPAK